MLRQKSQHHKLALLSFYVLLDVLREREKGRKNLRLLPTARRRSQTADWTEQQGGEKEGVNQEKMSGSRAEAQRKQQRCKYKWHRPQKNE